MAFLRNWFLYYICSTSELDFKQHCYLQSSDTWMPSSSFRNLKLVFVKAEWVTGSGPLAVLLNSTQKAGLWDTRWPLMEVCIYLFCCIFTVSVDILLSMKKPRLVCFLKSWRRSLSSTHPSGMISLSLVSILYFPSAKSSHVIL